MKEKIKIGNAGGFWGDDLNALNRQLEGGDLDYITSDYLAEITMSILRKQQIKNPALGYITDFIEQFKDVARLLKEKKVKLITNAGGINPLECGIKVTEILRSQNIDLKVAVVEGDNIYPRLSELYPSKSDFKNMETGESFEHIKNKVQSANAYLGVTPLIKALSEGADIIIAGRVTDTSITMVPMIYEFGWKLNDWDKLASGLVAGHIIECGAQSSGGNFTDWHLVPKWDNFGYPVVEVFPDGSFVVTKHPDTGGLVSIDTVKEQLVYEMGDPQNYISPDVVADFLTINLEQEAENRVRVYGIKGYPSTEFLKVSMAYEDGFKASGSIIISGPDSVKKAEKFSEIFWQRLNINFEKNNTEFIGFNSCHKNLSEMDNTNEVFLRFSVYDKDKNKISEFAKNIAPLILSGPPGVAVTGGRPSPQAVMTYYPALIKKEFVNSYVKILDKNGNVTNLLEVPSLTGFERKQTDKKYSTNLFSDNLPDFEQNEFVKVKLRKIALARSGDKGDTANIGVIGRNKELYLYLKKILSADFIKEKFSELCKGNVIRYELDNLMALNFLLEKSLDGGGTKSLMIDAQGKTFASALLNLEIDIPVSLLKNFNNGV